MTGSSFLFEEGFDFFLKCVCNINNKKLIYCLNTAVVSQNGRQSVYRPSLVIPISSLIDSNSLSFHHVIK